MKKICFVILILSSVLTISGQSYKPMLKENKTWHVERWNGAVSGTYTSYNYFLQGDTTVNNLTYHKIHNYNNVVTSPFFPSSIFDTTFYYDYKLIREDTIAKKIWGIDIVRGDTTEKLIYDFSRNVGDTLSFYNPFNTIFYSIIDSIRPYVLMNNDTTRIFYLTHLNSTWGGPFMIEGVGGIHGFFYPIYDDMYLFELSINLMCVKDSLLFLYPKHTTFRCAYFVDVDEVNLNKNNFSLFPNPTNNIITIEAEDLSSVILFNAYGQEISNIDSPNFHTEINIENQPKGIYFVVVEYNNGERKTTKLVIY